MTTHVLSTDSIQTGTGVDGKDFDASNETWIVARDVIVFSETAFGFASNGFDDETLVNKDRIYTAAEEAAVYFAADSGNATVVNAAEAEIFGARNGIDFLGSGSQVLDNHGVIIGADNNGVYFDHPTTSVLLKNYGYIFGASFGVENGSYNAGGTIDNFGVIRAGSTPPADEPSYPPAAIRLSTEPGLLTDIFNATGAKISGAVDAIYALRGAFHLVNDGNIVGNIVDADDAGDVIVNAGRINGAIYLEGNSIFKDASGTSGAIHVGDGDVVVTGSTTHADQFVFDSTLSGQVARITNFQHGVDKIVLSETVFTALGAGAVGHPLVASDFHVGASAHTPSQYMLYNPTNGFLSYDQDGSGTTYAPIHFATLTSHPALTHADFLVEA